MERVVDVSRQWLRAIVCCEESSDNPPYELPSNRSAKDKQPDAP